MLYNALSVGKKTPKTAPSPWDFVTLLEEDRATAIGNMHKNLLKVLEISSRTDIRVHTHTDVLITILCTTPACEVISE